MCLSMYLIQMLLWRHSMVPPAGRLLWLQQRQTGTSRQTIQPCEELGSGTIGKVYRAVNRVTGQAFAGQDNSNP